MNKMKTFLKYVLAVVFTLALTIGVVKNYSWIFAKSVEGEIFKVERVTDPTMIVGNVANNASAMHSFAVAIRTTDGQIYTASSEDRQWAVVIPGCKVKALFFRYPFWELQKTGTFFNARLDDMRDCPTGQNAAPALEAVPAAAPAAAPVAAPAETAPAAKQ